MKNFDKMEIVAFWFVLVGFFTLAYSSPGEHKPNQVQIIANNPYSLRVQLEVKCDWNGKERKYSYYKKIEINGKSKTILLVPGHMKKCEIWPKIKWL